MAEFTGFYFNNIHSSTYHLYRTSDGNRYEEGLIPDFEDRSVSLVGTDGDLYGERRFKATPFTIKIAFDSVTETDLRDIRNWLAEDELKPFQFDERPYKTYYVKVSSRPALDYLCFDEEDEWGNTIHIYKGEGSITFTAYDPFGYCVDESKVLGEIDGAPAFLETGLRNRQELDFYTSLGYEHGDDFVRYTFRDEDKLFYQVGERTTTNLELDNTVLWAPASGLLESDELSFYNKFEGYNDDYQDDTPKYAQCFTYNPGDRETSFQLLIDFNNLKERLITEKATLGEKQYTINRYAEDVPSHVRQDTRVIKNWDMDSLNTYQQINSLSKAEIEADGYNYNDWMTKIYNAKKDLQRYLDLESLINLNEFLMTIYIDNGKGTSVKSLLSFQVKLSEKYLLLDTKKHLISVWNSDAQIWEGRYDLIQEVQNNQWPTIPRGASRLAVEGANTNLLKYTIKYPYIYY